VNDTSNQQEKTTMFRKTILALAALGALALAPTAASAGGGKHHGGHHGHHGHHGGGKHWGHGGYGFGVSLYNPYVYGGCYNVKRIVATPFGPKLRYVTVCS
jgi:hypothetical protein